MEQGFTSQLLGKRMRQLGSITDSVDVNLSKLWEPVKCRKPGMLRHYQPLHPSGYCIVMNYSQV